MAIVRVKGKAVHLDDKIVEGGDEYIRMALAASFPDAATMDFAVERPEEAARVTERGAPAVITSRSAAVTKG